MREQRLEPAGKLTGETSVPGEYEPAAQAVLLAAMAEGKSRIRNVPPTIAPLLQVLRSLGVRIDQRQQDLVVLGTGFTGLEPPQTPIDLAEIGPVGLLLVAALIGQQQVSRFQFVEAASAIDSRAGLSATFQALLTSMGATIDLESVGSEPTGPTQAKSYRIGGAKQLRPIDCAGTDLESLHKLALGIAGMQASGLTTLTESGKGQDWVRQLRQRQVQVERQRVPVAHHGSAGFQGKKVYGYQVSIAGGQTIGPLDVEIPGQLRLAYPLMVAGLGIKGSELRIRHVAIHPGHRTFLDAMRQMGAPIALEENDLGTVDIAVKAGGLKSTRIAGKRAASLLEQVALVAVLATQAEGEFVIRDIGRLRQGDFDMVAHLAAVLREMGAKVGEFPEGIVIEGGQPLRGVRAETRGDANLGLAFSVAGLMAESEMTIVGSDITEQVFPQFYATIEACKENKR